VEVWVLKGEQEIGLGRLVSDVFTATLIFSDEKLGPVLFAVLNNMGLQD
jgi:hypothetical protein